jgi:hypothetical protein
MDSWKWSNVNWKSNFVDLTCFTIPLRICGVPLFFVSYDFSDMYVVFVDSNIVCQNCYDHHEGISEKKVTLAMRRYCIQDGPGELP